MRKIAKLLLLGFILCTVMALFSACDNNTERPTNPSDIDISDPLFGFVKEEEYDKDNFNINTAAKWTTLDADTDYYLFLTFDVTARQDNRGTDLLHVNIKFDALNVLNGTMEDVSTGELVEMPITDSNTGNPGKVTTVSFKIPSLSAKPKTINMIIRLKPISIGESHILISYDYDAPEGYKLLGSDGYTKNLKIEAVKIATPVLEVNNMGWLIWNHVKNADYYCVYVAGSSEPMTDYLGNTIVIPAERVTAGSPMSYNIAGNADIIGYNMLVIRGFSNNPNILESDNSNYVEFMWQ